MVRILKGKQAPTWQFNLVMIGMGFALLSLFIGSISSSTFLKTGAVIGLFFAGIGAICIFVDESIIARLIVGIILIASACLLCFRLF